MSTATVAVRLVAFEAVVQSGTRKTSWLVHHEGRWISAKDYPGAELEKLDAGPGTIWESAASLKLPVGTWVQQVQSTPRRGARQDPLRYLQQEARGMKRRVTRVFFRVGSRGDLRRPARGSAPP